MLIFVINQTLMEVLVLQGVTIILGFTIYFFIKSRKSLQETLNNQINLVAPSRFQREEQRRLDKKERELSLLADRLKTKRTVNVSSDSNKPYSLEGSQPDDNSKKELTDSLKATILKQQVLLNGFLKKVEEIENENKKEVLIENEALQKEITDLENRLEKRKYELEEWKQKALASEKIAIRLDDVQRQFEEMQSKMTDMEKKANKANILALELEETKESYQQLFKDLNRKQERLEEIISENQQIRHDLETMEDKLNEANLQRQQLQKKVQFLQDMNTDMQSMAETNKKLQTELRRIGELESMLNMISEERDNLLRRKNDT